MAKPKKSRHRRDTDAHSEQEIHDPRPPALKEHPVRDAGDVGRFADTEKAAWIVVTAIFTGAAALQPDAFHSIWTRHETVADWLRMVLFVQLVVLTVFWIAATHSELEMWIRWLDPHVYSSEFEAYVAIFGLAVALGLMFVFVYDITLISAYISAYLLLNLWAQHLANRRFENFLRKKKGAGVFGVPGCSAQAHRRVLEIMEKYWLERPHLERIAMMLLFSLAALGFSRAGQLKTAASALLTLALLGGEAWVYVWRHLRDKGIREITDVEV